MIAYGQVDGRARHRDATEARTDQWAATVADPGFWMWLQGHALTQAHATTGTVGDTFRALSDLAGDLLGHRADAVQAEMAATKPPHGNKKPR